MARILLGEIQLHIQDFGNIGIKSSKQKEYIFYGIVLFIF